MWYTLQWNSTVARPSAHELPSIAPGVCIAVSCGVLSGNCFAAHGSTECVFQCFSATNSHSYDQPRSCSSIWAWQHECHVTLQTVAQRYNLVQGAKRCHAARFNADAIDKPHAMKQPLDGWRFKGSGYRNHRIKESLPCAITLSITSWQCALKCLPMAGVGSSHQWHKHEPFLGEERLVSHMAHPWFSCSLWHKSLRPSEVTSSKGKHPQLSEPLPSGKRTKNYGKSPCYQWVNPL